MNHQYKIAEYLASEVERLRAQADALAEALVRLEAFNSGSNPRGRRCDACEQIRGYTSKTGHATDCPFAALDAYRAAKGAGDE